LFDGKMNVVGAFRRLKFPTVSKSARKNNTKIKKKWEFLHKISF